MKALVCTYVGIIASVLAMFFGGIDTTLIVLMVMMGIDYITGVIVAMVFKRSPKTTTGTANSTVGLKGICRKFYMLVLVGVANCLDMVLGSEFCRAGLVLAFIANEVLSIIENAGLMGIPIPTVLRNAVDVLSKKEEKP